MISEQLNQVWVKNTGPYLARAEALASAVELAIKEEFGIHVPAEKRGQDPKQPCYLWTLPGESVSVMVEKKGGTADPHIWVHRSDPVRKPPGETDWRNEWFGRAYETKLFGLGKIMANVRYSVEYNRKLRSEHEVNQDAFGRDLTGVVIPDGVTIERNAKTGFYELFMSVSIKELGGAEIKIAVAACRDFKKAVEPFVFNGKGDGNA